MPRPQDPQSSEYHSAVVMFHSDWFRLPRAGAISPPKITRSANWFQTFLFLMLLGKVATFGKEITYS